jgi:hypothetical protein
MTKIHAIYRFLAKYFRPRRYARFLKAFPPCKVLDFGGTAVTWQSMPAQFDVTLVNLDPEISGSGLKYEIADACFTPFEDRSFDLAFSNSVIEHVGDEYRQQKFASEMRRCGKGVYCQTPNFWFPIEPHLLTPFVHWIPKFSQSYFCMRYLTLTGWLVKPNREHFEREYQPIRLLKRDDVRGLFPDCEIWEERFLGMTKSFCAVRPSTHASEVAGSERSTIDSLAKGFAASDQIHSLSTSDTWLGSHHE